MVAHAFNHSGCAGVADGEAFAGDAIEEGFAGGCAVENDVATRMLSSGRKLEVLGG